MDTDGKLVRDRIPEIIEAAGGQATTRLLDPAERLTALLAKLQEESDEPARPPPLPNSAKNSPTCSRYSRASPRSSTSHGPTSKRRLGRSGQNGAASRPGSGCSSPQRPEPKRGEVAAERANFDETYAAARLALEFGEKVRDARETAGDHGEKVNNSTGPPSG